MRANPFTLFPRQVETAELWQYTAAGIGNIKLATLSVIVKRTTATDSPAMEYQSRIATQRFHIRPESLPLDLCNDPELLVNLIIKHDNRTFIITEVSRGDDMERGTIEFVTVKASPYGKTSL